MTRQNNKRQRISRLIIKRRLFVAASGYVVVIIFLGAFIVAFEVWPMVSFNRAMIIAALVAAPAAFALVWDRLTSFKILSLEVKLDRLAEATVRLDEVLSHAVREQRSSATPALVAAIPKYVERNDDVILINLRDGEYWWPTRLFLLAAIADDFSGINRLVFVERNEERRYIGMATPRVVRRRLMFQRESISNKVGDEPRSYEEIYRQLQSGLSAQNGGMTTSAIIEPIIYQWEHSFHGGEESQNPQEKRVSCLLLKKWLEGKLETDYIDWDGSPESFLLYFQILECDTPFVALVENGRLRKVVKRSELASRIAKEAVRMKLTRAY